MRRKATKQKNKPHEREDMHQLPVRKARGLLERGQWLLKQAIKEERNAMTPEEELQKLEREHEKKRQEILDLVKAKKDQAGANPTAKEQSEAMMIQ